MFIPIYVLGGHPCTPLLSWMETLRSRIVSKTVFTKFLIVFTELFPKILQNSSPNHSYLFIN